VRRIESAALLVRSVPFGEADVIATFFTEEAGKLSAIVRGARRSTKRFGGALEPIHELFVTLEDKGKELCVLKEARIGRPRTGITTDLAAMEAAGHGLRWLRHLCPARTPEPAVWRSVTELLDALDALDALRDAGGRSGLGAGLASQHVASQHLASQHLASFGLRVLADVGYAVELERCVRCGKTCPEGRTAYVDAAAGGVVCSSCGGARRMLSGPLRQRARALLRGEAVLLERGEAAELAEMVEEAMAAHAGFDPARLSGGTPS